MLVYYHGSLLFLFVCALYKALRHSRAFGHFENILSDHLYSYSGPL